MQSLISENATETPQNFHRPRSVTVLAGLHFLQSLALLGFGLYSTWKEDWLTDGLQDVHQFLPLVLFDSIVSGAILLVLAGLGVIIAFALLRLHAWAWLAAIILQGLGLLAAILAYIHQQPNYLGMLIGIILVLYLNRRDVQEAFRARGAVFR